MYKVYVDFMSGSTEELQRLRPPQDHFRFLISLQFEACPGTVRPLEVVGSRWEALEEEDDGFIPDGEPGFAFDPVLSVICIIVLCSWQALGYAVLIYLVGFKSLPVSLYEAAKLDGASGPQSFWYLSIPMLKPITLYVSVVTLVSGFNVYAQAFVLASDAQGAPGRQVRVLVLDMLENSFRNYRVGYAASEAVVLLVIVLVLTLIQFSMLRERGRA